MIRFSDPRLYLKGTSEAMLTDKSSGNIVYFSDKFQSAGVNVSVTQGEIRAGLGNPIAAMIPSDAAVSVSFTAADFSLFAKAAQAGSSLSYGAPVMVCQDVTASSASLTVPVSGGTPVANLGMSQPLCYVQEVGAGSPISTGGIAYPINSSTGAVSDFAAVSGKTYKVWYYVSKAGAQLATLGTNLDPKVLHFSASMAVYCNTGGGTNTGTRVGTLHVIVPNLKLGGDGAGVTGDQTNPDTTAITGQALAYDDTAVSGGCTDCTGGSALAYYLYVPCDEAYNVLALALPGGVLSVKKSTTYAIHDFYLVMADRSLAPVDNALATYTLDSAPSGTTVSGGTITTGSTTGNGTITASVTVGGSTYTCAGTLSVTA